MYRLRTDRVLTPAMVLKYKEKNEVEIARKQKLYDYYLGKNSILNRTMVDTTKPNNKVANAFAHYITKIYVGYFMGEPITYSGSDDELLEKIKEINSYNDEASENAELAKDASIFGVAYELVYLDKNSDIRFKKIDAMRAVPIYDNTLENEMLYFIRYYDETDILTDEVSTIVEVYSRDSIITYKEVSQELHLVSEATHAFGIVPVIVYENNPEQLGDYERVITLIDAYDTLQSDSVNDMEYFADAYLAFTGMDGTEAEDVVAMKEQRVLLLPENGKAEWLIKDAKDTTVENLKTRIEESIHKQSMCPSMTDKEFASNASGVAMKYKLMGIETSTSDKERAFKKGLQRRVEILCNILNVLGSAFSYLDIAFSFKRNVPENLVEIADSLNKIGHLLSNETQVGLLPIEIDYQAEKQRMADEEQAGYSLDFTANE